MSDVGNLIDLEPASNHSWLDGLDPYYPPFFRTERSSSVSVKYSEQTAIATKRHGSLSSPSPSPLVPNLSPSSGNVYFLFRKEGCSHRAATRAGFYSHGGLNHGGQKLIKAQQLAADDAVAGPVASPAAAAPP